MAGSLLNFDVPELLAGKNYIKRGNLQAVRRTGKPFSQSSFTGLFHYIDRIASMFSKERAEFSACKEGGGRPQEKSSGVRYAPIMLNATASATLMPSTAADMMPPA